MSLLQQRLENERQETIRVRVELEKARKELLEARSEQQSSTLRFDLDSQSSEVSRLNQIIEAMTAELEATKRENAQVRSGVGSRWPHDMNKLRVHKNRKHRQMQ